ncbi:unnamed protein product [Urochloa humidicola]
MNDKKHGHGESPYCCFHPREVVVGVCAQCLKDRLLLLLAAAAAGAGRDDGGRRTSSSGGGISLPKQVLALGSSFLQRLDSRHHRPGPDDSSSGSGASLDDSFISIKFEDNGKATWDSNSRSSSTAVVAAAEHGKRGRWRKQVQVVGRLLQLARWKRSAERSINSNKAKARGWIIRTLTLQRRRK